MPEIYRTLARANQWANQRLYPELARLSPEQWTQVSAVNFGSVQGIANHLLLADQAWLFRFTGQGPSPERIDIAPWPEPDGLWAERQALDARIIAFADALDAQRLAGVLRYRSMKGVPCEEPFALCLAHFFNHQAFHRGQLHALAGVFGVVAPDLDLIYYQSAQRRGQA